MFYFDSTMLILLPALIIATWAQFNIQASYSRYSKVYSRNGYTGSQVARMILDGYGLFHVPVVPIGGKLTDHFDPKENVVRLSQDVFYGASIASIGVAAHEVGHAIQHRDGYVPIKIRMAMVPIANLGSSASWMLFILGFILSMPALVNLGILLFTAVVLFQIVTLPVEFNASNRAVAILKDRNILHEDELTGTKKVLRAAGFTYVAAALTAIAQLLRLIALSDRER
ncbi:zinc metallopeptidase [Clostridium sp. UBA4548]|uniref:zinc metallopeptidase n=1 Tax=Clostridium sp. UBA4548 TaxID=1946361 RepID=UPI0025BD3D8E|nr:zinc metallopeptidase [Clostridium sp. UBA4548]